MIIKNLRYTEDFSHNGKVYSLAHLRPIILSIIVKGQAQKVQVEFSSHVFTEKYNANIHSHTFKIHDKSNWQYKKHHYRAFNEVRYNLSLNLPKIFANIHGSSKFYRAEKGNFIVRQHTYYVFFNMYVNSKTGIIKIYVKSAYPMKFTTTIPIIKTLNFEKAIFELLK